MILVINPGSSSLKYKLFDRTKEISSNTIKVLPNIGTKNHFLACEKMLDEISENIEKVKIIGIRVVHGGAIYEKPALIDRKVISDIKKLEGLAPLHNPPALRVIKSLKKQLPNIPFYAVFDTSFYYDLPGISKMYPLPLEISEKHKIRRYGFHGISHKYTCSLIDPKKENRVISIHLGGGCSITAVNKGKVLDTSMGFTPDEGLVMQTRSGDLDPGLVLFLVKTYGYKKTKEIIENKSGMAGLTGTNGEMLEILELAGENIEGDDFKGSFKRNDINSKQSKEALEIYITKIKKYIGAYAALMGGVDIIVFTGKIGACSNVIREKVMKDLGFLKYTKFDFVQPDEELAIACEIMGETNE